MPSNGKCPHVNNCDSVLPPAALYDPDRLFDPSSTPTIYLGPLSIPGPLLPLIISVVFVFYKLGKFIARRNHQIQLEIERLPPTPAQNNLQWPDLRHPDALRIYAAKANLAFHGIITIGAVMHFGTSFLENDTLCCVEVVALLLYAEIVKSETRKSCLAAAVGWTLFMFLDQAADGIATAATWLVIMLAAPLAWQVDGIKGDMELQQSISGLLLMLMLANRVVFDSQAATQQWVQDSPMEAGKYLAALHVFNGLMMWILNRNGEPRLWYTRWGLQQTLTTFRRGVPVALNSSILVMASLAIHAGGTVCTAYLSSCLPWSTFLFSKCASPPSLSTASLLIGICIYSNIFLIVELTRLYCSRGHFDRAIVAVLRAQLETGANVIGWACLFFNTFYVALRILL